MSMVKELLFAESSEKLLAAKHRIDSNVHVQQNKKFKSRLQSYWERREEWCVCLRKDFVTRGNNTNNYSESAIRITKDIVFDRLKAYNSVQLFQFVTTTMDLYYKQRLLSLANNRLDNFVALRFTISGTTAPTVSSHTIQATDSEDVFQVQSRTDNQQTWTVDLAVGTCTCPRGRNGQPCAHQLAASLKYRRHSLNKIPTSSVCGRQLYAKIAIGKAALPVEFYSHLHQKEEDNYMKVLGMELEWCRKSESFPDIQETEYSDQEETISFPSLEQANEDPQLQQNQVVSSSFDETLTDLTHVMTDMKQGLASGDAIFETAVREFCRQYKKIRGGDGRKGSYTKPSLISALHKFGKGHGQRLRSNKWTIPVQATALSRRATKHCGGKPLKAGRPSLMQKKSKTENTQDVCRHILPKRKLRLKRIHCLQQSIDDRRQNSC